MLKDAKSFGSFSTNDIDKAKKFYSEVLGLEVEQDEQMGNILKVKTGDGHFMVYPKPDHTPATFTVYNFLVNDIDEAVTGLKEKGVPFESYDSEYMKTDENDIMRGGGGEKGPNIAWFKDPAGNILSLIEDTGA